MPENTMIELLCQLTHAETLQQLCDLTYQITGNPVFVCDMAHTILAFTRCVQVDDETWQNNIVTAHLDKNTLRQDLEVGSVHEASTEAGMPVLVQDSHMTYPRLIKALTYNHQPIGTMVLTAYLQPFREHDMELVELISSFVLTCLTRERYRLSPDSGSVVNYFIKLLDGDSFSPDGVDRHLEVLGFHPRRCTYVIAACVDESTEQALVPGSTDQMLLELSSALHAQVFSYNTLLICVYTSDEPVFHWEEQLPSLDELLRRWGLTAGISRRLTALSHLREGYLQAQAALEKGRLLNRGESWYCFDSLSSYMLFDRIPANELDGYCNERILNLWDYDQEHGTELCATLQVYLEQAKSLAKTAEILYIHRNTVRYRVNRCMELLDDRLEDGNDIFSYIFSLRILEYRRKIHFALPERSAPARTGRERERSEGS